MYKKKKQQPKKVKLSIDYSRPNNKQQVWGDGKSHSNSRKYCTLHSNSDKVIINLPFHERQNKSFKCQTVLRSAKITKVSDLPLKQKKKTLRAAANARKSYEEYCVIDKHFIPISKGQELDMVEKYLISTASSTQGFNTFKEKQGQKTDRKIKIEVKLRKKAKLIKFKTESSNENENYTIQQMKNVQRVKPTLHHDAQIDAIPESKQVGLQYSQRNNEEAQDNSSSNTQHLNTNLNLNTLIKSIQDCKIIDQGQLSQISPLQAELYTSILQNLLTKLNKQKYVQKMEDFQQNKAEDSPQKQKANVVIQYDEEQLKSLQTQQQQYNKLKKIEQIQHLICLRECKQISFIEDQSTNVQIGQISTNLLSVISFLCQLFAFIEIHYCQEFVRRIQRIYGLSYKQKFYRISQGIQLTFEASFDIVHEEVFFKFMEESGKENLCERIHLKAVFDGLNEHLQEYRPYFMGNGQPFAWSIKMLPSMSEYSIDEQSMPIIFRQAKQKMVQWCVFLCGLFIEKEQKVLNHPLRIKHKEKENKLICNWIKEGEFEKDSIEVNSTEVLYDVGEWIFEELIEELLSEL